MGTQVSSGFLSSAFAGAVWTTPQALGFEPDIYGENLDRDKFAGPAVLEGTVGGRRLVACSFNIPWKLPFQAVDEDPGRTETADVALGPAPLWDRPDLRGTLRSSIPPFDLNHYYFSDRRFTFGSPRSYQIELSHFGATWNPPTRVVSVRLASGKEEAYRSQIDWRLLPIRGAEEECYRVLRNAVLVVHDPTVPFLTDAIRENSRALESAYRVYWDLPRLLSDLERRTGRERTECAFRLLEEIETNAAQCERSGFLIFAADLRLAACRVYETAHCYPQAQFSLDRALDDLDRGGDPIARARALPLDLGGNPR